MLPLSQPVDGVDSSYGVLTTSLLISLSDSFPAVPGGQAKSSVVDIKVGPEKDEKEKKEGKKGGREEGRKEGREGGSGVHDRFD